MRDVLSELGKADQLDPKLAEYAFFPLAQQVFNETKRLSPRCLEVASECVTILVASGYRQALVPELGKHLLILMSMLAGAGNIGEGQAPSDDLKIAAFTCMSEVTKALTSSKSGSSIFEDQGTRNVVDQLVYLLLEAVADSPAEQVQISASEVLVQLITAIQSRVFLASLLPRTVSSLTKALRPSTHARRTKKVLTTNLKTLRVILDRTLADRFASDPANDDGRHTLGEAWLKATSSQVKNAVVEVVKLRNHESSVVRRALEELCVMLLEECRTTLADSIIVVLETLIMLSAKPDGESARSTCRHLLIVYPEMAETVRSSLINWSRSLPRLMQGHDEQPKFLALQRLTATLQALSDSQATNTMITDDLTAALVSGISNALQDEKSKAMEIHSESSMLPNMFITDRSAKNNFGKVILDQESQKGTTEQLQRLVAILKETPESSRMIRCLTNCVADSDGASKLASFWLVLQLLKNDSAAPITVDDFLIVDAAEDKWTGRSSLLSDLQATTLPMLDSVFDDQAHDKYSWQMQALAMECTVMYAQTFEGDSYRPELMDTLYPVLSFLGSPNSMLRSHAIIALDKLAVSCQYSSTTEMVIDNVDYLVNSVAWKLTTYNLSPEAPKILRMMVYLCGAKLIPYLDDLVQSVFAALDSYHGYPEWVETLFRTLKAMVDVCIEQPQLAITPAKDVPIHEKSKPPPSSPGDILDDLRSRKRRRLDFDRPAEALPKKAPQRPWTDELDGPSFPKPVETAADMDGVDESNEHLSPMKPPEEEEKKLSKPHSLLLSIANATVPHIASPSPRVRHLLLGLLKEVSPLLGTDENTFLPLINAIWPVIVPRLFTETASDGSGNNEEETAYNICAAADTAAMLCINAGDFMSSRIDDIFPQLMRLFERIGEQVDLRSQNAKSNTKHTQSIQLATQASQESLSGPVSLRIVQEDALRDANTDWSESETQLRSFHQTTRTSKGQILNSLIDLLVTVLSHVQQTLDSSDEIMRLLLPFILHKEGIHSALEIYNAEAVWLWNQKIRADPGGGDGIDDRPMLRDSLKLLGLCLVDITT